MYFLYIRIYLSITTFTLLLVTTHLPTATPQFVLTSLTVTQTPQSFTVPYNKTLASLPSNYAYFIESGSINQPELYVRHVQNESVVDTTQVTIRFVLEGVGVMAGAEMLKVKLLVSSYASDILVLGMYHTTGGTPVEVGLPVTYDPAAPVKDLEAKVFILNFPMTFVQALNTTHLTITPSITPSPTITAITFSILIITRKFASYHVGLLIDDVKLGNLGWIIVFNNDSFFDPSEDTMLVGINSYLATSTPILDLADDIDYNFSFPLTPDQRSIFLFYNIDSTPLPTVMDTTIFIFSEVFTSCPQNGFLTYTELYYDSPLSCQACDVTCATCTTANYSLTLTDQYSCLTCGVLKYFLENGVNSTTGQCVCYPGLDVNSTTQECLPCTSDCLGFSINFMRSSTDSQFLLTFSSPAQLLTPMESNLLIYVNDTTQASYSLTLMKTNFYSISVSPSALTACNTKCVVRFQFSQPWKVLKKGKNEALSQTYATVEIQNYYVVDDKIPDQLNQAFTISSMLVGASAGGGLSSMLKMLFQLQQMIEFHKYLNIQMPLVFKEFIESLSIFRFLDITTVFPYDIDVVLQDLSTSQFDTIGPIKPVYYESGINFYKNIIPVVVSFGMILVINFVLFFLFRIVPCKLFWRLSEKLRVRALITFSDLVETMIVPVMVFAHFQLSIVYYRADVLWMYVMTMAMVFVILFIPFFVIAHVHINRHNKLMKDVYEDLLLDCHLDNSATYAFYVISYYRKVLFGLSLLYYIPGMVQGSCIIAVNTIYLSFMLYVISQKIFNSKLKMLTKTINVLCVIGIEIVMLYYNKEQHSIELMLDLGASCVYLAIIATITGVVEFFIKLFEMIFQNVKEAQGHKQVNAQNAERVKKQVEKENRLEKDFANPIYCNIGKDTILPFHSKDSLETASVDTRDKNKVSVFTRARNKLGFMAGLRKNNNNKMPKQSPSLEQRNEESYEQMMDRFDKNGIIGMDSLDELGFGVQKKEGKSKRYGQNNKANLKNKLSMNPKAGLIEYIDYDQGDKQQKKESDHNSGQDFIMNEQQQQHPNPTTTTVDQQILAIQDRIRQKMNLPKPSNSPPSNPFSTIVPPSSNPRRRVQRQSSLIDPPATQRVKNEQKDDKLIENINGQKTARRRKVTTKKTDLLRVKESRKGGGGEGSGGEDEDIYYVR